jgi:hypothetical protein
VPGQPADHPQVLPSGQVGVDRGLVTLDLAMLAAVLLAAPAFVWPMALAIPASLARVGITLRRLPSTVAR